MSAEQRLKTLGIALPAGSELGSLDRVARVVEIQGFLNATPEFEDHAKVLNGCSDLLVEIFAERGIHARSVLGASSLRGVCHRRRRAIRGAEGRGAKILKPPVDYPYGMRDFDAEDLDGNHLGFAQASKQQ